MQTTTTPISTSDLEAMGFDLRLCMDHDGRACGSAIYPFGASFSKAAIEAIFIEGEVAVVYLAGGSQRLVNGSVRTTADLARLIEKARGKK